MLDMDSRRQEGYLGPIDTPDDFASSDDGPTAADGSLTDDLSALLSDGRTYVEAEITYQKSRLAFVGDRTKGLVVFGLGVLAFLHLALIGITVGAILILGPLIGYLGATLIVVGVLLVGVVVLGLMAKGRVSEITAAFSEKSQ